MAQIVLLGANVGTAVTAWIVSTGIEWLSPLIILAGIVLVSSGSSTAQNGMGTALIGVGLMLLSLHLLSLATEPIRHSPALAAFIGLLDNAWLVAMIFSAGVAFLSSSSLAAVVLILSLASTGVLSAGLTVIALVLGANLGGAVPPVLSRSPAPASTRRVTYGNLIVRAAGCLIALPLAGYLGAFLHDLPSRRPNARRCPSRLQSPAGCRRLAAVAAARRMMTRLVPDEPQSRRRPEISRPASAMTPVVALANATREVLGIGDLIERC